MKKYKLAAALAACVMVVSQLAVPNVAAAGDTIDSVQIKKYLVIKKNVTAPTVSFTYTLASGTAIPATDTTHEIKAGPDGAVFASTGGTSMTVVFAPDDALTPESSAPSGSTIQFATADTSDEAYVEKDITVDLSGVTFPAAGIYRYIITEQTPEATGITYDSVNKRYIDVFVHKYDQGEDTTARPTRRAKQTRQPNPPDSPTATLRTISAFPRKLQAISRHSINTLNSP